MLEKMMLKKILFTSALKQISTKNYIIFRKMSETNDVIFETVKDKGIISLNRPKGLNSLTLSMVKKILPQLIKWEQEKSMVIVKGVGDKAFCAGGDVKAIVLSNMKGENYGQEFFKHEYTTNGVIGTYKIPYIALIDRIVMGGGVGLSIHGHYRVATERTMFAMPETIIGLFPDVGTSYVLPRLGGKLGLYLALTGERLNGYDVLKAGIATHYVESQSLPDLEKALLDCNNEHDINAVLKRFSKIENAQFSLAPYMDKINKYFAADTVENIVKNLKEDNSEWAQNNYKLLMKMSPTSMKVSMELLERGAKLSTLNECLQMEYNVANNTLKQNDFTEGVRARLIDKDQAPKWNPPTLEQVTTNFVEQHFLPVPGFNDVRNKL